MFCATLSFGLLFAAAYGIAHRLSGDGVNEAVLYHLRTSCNGAALWNYPFETLLGVGSMILVPALALQLSRLARKRPCGGVPRHWLPVGLAIAAIAINPIWGHGHMAAPVTKHPRVADFAAHYRTPEIHRVSSPRNLVYLYAESFERTYFDENRFPGLVSHLRSLECSAVSFTGLKSAFGSGWTVGGMVASQCGIPLGVPADGNSMAGMDRFLPGVTGLGGLLKSQGYRLIYMGGADLRFAGKGMFYRDQGFDEVLGKQELLPALGEPGYQNRWGLYDDSLLSLAKKKYDELLRQPAPFALFLLTVDTHGPHGERSRSVASIHYWDGGNEMLNAVAASDVLLAGFLSDLRSDPRSANTVFVLASDHLAMPCDATELLAAGPRENLFMVLSPSAKAAARIATTGCTMDIGPTLLPFLGFGGQIGLGRNLLDPDIASEERALLSAEDTLRGWHRDLMRFWDFPSLPELIVVSPATHTVRLGDRQFGLPCLIEIAPDRRTTLRFGQRFGNDTPLDAYLPTLPPDSTYILIDRRPILDGGRFRSMQWYMACGGRPGRRIAVDLPSDRETPLELAALFAP